jgi:RNA polymerase sigma-70 factor, ECF subfamily
LLEDVTIEELFHLYADDVNHFLTYYTNQYDVEDLVQETFLKALKGLRSYKGNASYKTWLFTIARNVAHDYARKQKHKTWVSDDFYQGLPSQERLPEEMAELSDTYNQLLSALNDIKPKYREIILLRTVMDLSLKEIAEVFGWTTNRVRVMLHRGLKDVRKRVEVRGALLDDIAK